MSWHPRVAGPRMKIREVVTEFACEVVTTRLAGQRSCGNLEYSARISTDGLANRTGAALHNVDVSTE